MKGKLGLLMALGPKLKGGGKGDDREARESAAEAVLSAIASKDASALSDALEQHYASCEGMGGEAEDSED